MFIRMSLNLYLNKNPITSRITFQDLDYQNAQIRNPDFQNLWLHNIDSWRTKYQSLNFEKETQLLEETVNWRYIEHNHILCLYGQVWMTRPIANFDWTFPNSPKLPFVLLACTKKIPKRSIPKTTIFICYCYIAYIIYMQRRI